MPTYEYECRKCGHQFEELHGVFETPVKSCPKCKGPVKKLISAGAGVIVKSSAGDGPACGRDTPCQGCPQM